MITAYRCKEASEFEVEGAEFQLETASNEKCCCIGW
jgi:hypothetical protein